MREQDKAGFSPSPDIDLGHDEEITRVLSGVLPRRALHHLLDATIPDGIDGEALARLSVTDVEEGLRRAGIDLLQLTREAVQRVLAEHPEAATLEERYATCSRALSEDRNPLVPPILAILASAEAED